MKILVTAFEPFGGESENPTSQIISLMKDVDTLLLPVSFADAPKITIQRIKVTNPDAVILLGQAGGRAAISLERIAVNLANAKNPDNDGIMPIEEPIFETGPSAYFCKLHLSEIRDCIRQQGVPCHISNSAGTFVCNTLYYSVMHEFLDLPVIFIHVPYSPLQAVTKNITTPSMNVIDMSVAVNAVVAFLRQYGLNGFKRNLNLTDSFHLATNSLQTEKTLQYAQQVSVAHHLPRSSH